MRRSQFRVLNLIIAVAIGAAVGGLGRLKRAGLKVSGSGVHQSKTLMLVELTAFLRKAADG